MINRFIEASLKNAGSANSELLERNRLREERDRLHRQIAALVAHSERVKGSTNSQELHGYWDDLAQHQREFRAFLIELDRFRRQYGPLGD